MTPDAQSALARGREYIRIEMEALQATAEALDESFVAVVQAIEAAQGAGRKLIFSGVGKSALTRWWIAHRDWPAGTRCIGHSFYSQGSHDQSVSARAFLFRALALGDGPVLGADLLSPRLHQRGAGNTVKAARAERDSSLLKHQLERVEAQVIREAMRRHKGNKTHVADELGLTRVGLRMKLMRLGLEKDKAPF